MKTYLRIQAFITVLMLSMMMSGCGLSDPETAVSIDGHEFTLDSTVQDIIDAGFALGNTGHSSEAISKADYSKYALDARIMSEKYFYILTDELEDTHISIRVYNPDSKKADLVDCKIYEFCLDYDDISYYDGNGVPITLSGVRFDFTDCRETAESLEASGIRFKEEDVDAFSENDKYGNSVIDATGLHGMSVSIYHSYNYHEDIVQTNGFRITKKLNYKFE